MLTMDQVSAVGPPGHTAAPVLSRRPNPSPWPAPSPVQPLPLARSLTQVLASNELTMAGTAAMPALFALAGLALMVRQSMRPRAASPGQVRACLTSALSNPCLNPLSNSLPKSLM